MKKISISLDKLMFSWGAEEYSLTGSREFVEEYQVKCNVVFTLSKIWYRLSS